MGKEIKFVVKTIDVISGARSCAAWLVAMWKPLLALPLTGVAFIVVMLMMIFAILAVIASVHGHGIMLLVLFFASFFLIGLYLLDDPDWVRVIGFPNLGYLIAGLVAWRMPQSIETFAPADS